MLHPIRGALLLCMALLLVACGGDGANLENASFERATMVFGSFSGAMLTNVSLFQARVATIDFSSTTMSNVTCPNGTNSNGNGNSCDGQFIDRSSRAP